MERDTSRYSAAAAVLDPEPQSREVPPNGGFPEPPPGAAIRIVRTSHPGCGGETRVRLPADLPATAVRRVVCHACASSYETSAAEEIEVLPPDTGPLGPSREAVMAAAEPAARAPRPSPGGGWLGPPPLPSFSRPGWLRLPDWAADPSSRAWRLASIAVAAAAVIGALLLIQGGEGGDPTPLSGTPSSSLAQAPPPEPAGKAEGPGDASLIRESSFSLALPPGWERTGPAGGATFAATSATGGADATLWVERDPGLSFAEFESRSLDQLEALAGSAHVVERVAAPTPEGTVVRLAADAPADSPAYEVTLRAAGPFRYYLATTVQPGASAEDTDAVALVHGSFVPTVAGDAQ